MRSTSSKLSFTAVMLLSSLATAHPFHASTSEIEWNEKTQRFEVAMRLRIVDLEDAISAKLKRRFRLESGPNRDEQLTRYLQQHFTVSRERDKTCRLHWVGLEFELHDVWVFVEAESSRDAKTIPAAGASAPLVQVKPSENVDRWNAFLRSATPSASPGRILIRNTTLTEIQPEQVNIVTLLMGGRKWSGTFTTKLPQQAVEVR